MKPARKNNKLWWRNFFQQHGTRVICSAKLLSIFVSSLLLFIILSGWSGRALAQTEDDVELQKHFRRAKVAFELGNYDEARREYESAYKVKTIPSFLFNIGQCHRNLGQYDKAIYFFRLYLKKKPKVSNREAIEDLISELEFKLEEQKSRKESTTKVDLAPSAPVAGGQDKAMVMVTTEDSSDNPPLAPKPFYKTWWFWTAAAVTVAIVGGVTIYYATRDRGPNYPSTDLGVWDASGSK